MKEAFFVKQHIDKWHDTERLAETADRLPPDELAEAYIDITADLAFAQTHYPKSRTTHYLNSLAYALHNKLYRNKREPLSRLITFWTRELPLVMYDVRRELLLSFCLFWLFVFVGVVSTLGDPDFARTVLGTHYVEMTLENIAEGRPMDVYGNSQATDMFASITLNNVLVSLRTFGMGIFTSFGSAYSLFVNGVMVGSFQTFFVQQGLFWQSFLSIWCHGTIEITTIIVEGAAGIVLGNGWLFPGTYSRWESFRRSARRGLKVTVGAVPLVVLAAFLEGFVTRHTELPTVVRLGIILLSLAFMVYYYVILPRLRHQQLAATP